MYVYLSLKPHPQQVGKWVKCPACRRSIQQSQVTLNPQPSTLNPEPCLTLNPKP